MLVKIQNSGGRWTLFDNAEQVNFGSNIHTINSEAEMHDLVPPDVVTQGVFILPGITLNSISPSSPIQVGVVEFVRSQKPYVVVFSSLLYICNDNGKTVEKVIVEHGRSN